MGFWKNLFGRASTDRAKETPEPFERLGDHKIGPKGTCIVCGCSVAAIRHNGWACRNSPPQTSSPHPQPTPDLSPSKGTSPQKSAELQKITQVANQSSKRKGSSAKGSAQFFECPKPTNDFGLCSDDNCPCDPIGVSIKRGEGHLYISKEVVDFRRDCIPLAKFETKIAALRSLAILQRGMPMNTRVVGFEKMGLPILVCEQGARLRKLDLAVAHEDAKRWWMTGKVPLRATPQL